MLSALLLRSHDEWGELGLLFIFNFNVILSGSIRLNLRVLAIRRSRTYYNGVGIIRVAARALIHLLHQGLRNGWIQFEFLVHGTYQREQIVVRLPLGESRADIHVLAIFANLVMHNAVHHVNRRWHLRELIRDLDANK